jgi:FkbM family methyltransferase
LLSDVIYHALAPFPRLKRQAARVVRRLPHRQRVVSMRGQSLSIDPSELSGFYLYYEREYDVPIFDFLDTIVGRYSMALDIGANIGIYTCYLAARVARVIAFEPDEENCRSLAENLGRNQLGNVTIERACVGRESGTAKFFTADRRNNGIGSMIEAPGEARGIRCVCLDDLFRPPFGPCLIKLDIEGAEWLALSGARRLLSAPDVSADILMEVHPDQLRKAGIGLDKLHSLLVEMGYNVSGLDAHGLHALSMQQDGERFWWATKTPRKSAEIAS